MSPRDAARYFREHPALDRVLREAAKRYRTYNGLRGRIRLRGAEEIRAVRGIGARVSGGGSVDVAELDAALRERTLFACPLRDALEAYLGEPLATREETTRDEAARKAKGRARIRSAAEAGGQRAAAWLERDEDYLLGEWGRAPGATMASVEAVCKALVRLPESGGVVQLPVLATSAQGNAHALDAGSQAGRFFERALLANFPDAEASLPLDAEAREAFLASAGIAIDDVSSAVLVSGLEGETEPLRALRAAGLAWSVPLRSVPACASAGAWGGVAWAVENPTVFSALCDEISGIAPDRRPTLVCTNGNLRLAAWRLLDVLAASGAVIRYGGDFDAAGLAIARRLARRFGSALKFWRMDPESHAFALERSGGTGDPLAARYDGLEPDFPALVPRMRERGAAHQEAVLPLLASDLRAFVDARLPGRPAAVSGTP